MTDLNKLEDKIVQTFTPLWEFNDLAHRVEHFSQLPLPKGRGFH